MFRPALFVLALMLADAPSWAASTSTEEIVRRSVKNTNSNWEAAPQYSFTERDVTEKQGKRTTKTSRVMMIEGSPYYRLQSVNDEPLSLRQNANEERKLRDETDRRRRETPAARQKRIAEYGQERRQNEELMREMAAAFKFEPLPEETVAGHRCFVLAATPRPGYKPQSR